MAAADHVVVDAGGFIRNAPIREIGKEVYTSPEVVNEITDKATRQRLQVLPYTLNMKKPSAEAIVFVTDFAKKTGDYKHLSATDIRVMALTYMLEKQHAGDAHIRKEPLNKPAEYIVPSKGNSTQQMAGFYMGRKDKSQNEENSDDAEPKTDVTETTDADAVDPSTDTVDASTDGAKMSSDAAETNTESVEPSTNACELTSEDTDGLDTEDVAEPPSQDGETEMDDVLPETLIEEEEPEEEVEDDDDDDDDDDGWITPSNINSIKRQMGTGSSATETTRVTVACLTTDFAMQNVLIQMELNVVSVDGFLIKQARSYVLRCFACFKITYNMMKVFCPNCGNKTLKRVAMMRDEEGKVHYYFSRRPLNTKGMKYPLPKPQGGKHGNNPLLFEDQPAAQQRPRKNKLPDVFDPDYLASSSPFAVHDLCSRAATIGISDKHDFRNTAYWNKRNPNEPRRRHGRKK